MTDGFAITRRDVRALAEVQPLWEALFDHHSTVSSPELVLVRRAETWPRRVRHYESLFADHHGVGLWIAAVEARAVGYALSYRTTLSGDGDSVDAVVLETLSVLPELRGNGVGTSLMAHVVDDARHAGITTGVVDVLGGNNRARALYLRTGYRPLSETWMFSAPPAARRDRAGQLADLRAAATAQGLALDTAPGPDDTWESCEVIVDLNVVGHRPVGPGQPAAEHRQVSVGLPALLRAVLDAGYWTIRFEIPAAPGAELYRSTLRSFGFALSTERLVRAF